MVSTNQTGEVTGCNEVVKVAGKRQFSDAYRIRIVEEANSCTKIGEVGVLLRR